MAGTSVGLKAFDVLETVNHITVDVGSTSTLLVDKNPNRRYLLIQNDSDQVVYLSHSVPAELNKGIRLEANGGCIEMSQMFSNICHHRIYAIQAKTTKKRVLASEGM